MRCILTLLSVVLLAFSASAQGADQPEDKPGRRHHDGLFLQPAVGAALVGDRFTLKSDTAESDGRIDGFAVGADFAAGGTVSVGKAAVVLGGSIFAASLLSPTVEIDGTDVSADRAYSLTIFSAFADTFLNPGDGLHFLGSVGYGVLATEIDGARATVRGPLFGFGIGYEWWLTDQWSLGPQSRIVLGPLSGDSDGVERSHFMTAPMLLATLTCH